MRQHYTAPFSSRTFRFGKWIDTADLPDAAKLDARQQQEIIDLLKQTRQMISLNDFLDRPFTKRSAPGHKSRFSDGTFGVYYSALEKQTARIEAEDFFRKIAMDGAGQGTSRIAHYKCISCLFNGIAMDLMPQSGTMPELVADDYEPCIQIAKDARAKPVDGLMTPSAACARRSQSGVCLPTFTRTALSLPEDEGEEKFAFP